VAVQVVTAILAFFTLLPIAAMAPAWGYYAWRCRHPWPTPLAPPEVAVILPLRGADPLLESCLAGVLAQDYPAYQVHIVIDSAQDSSQAMVARMLARGHAPNAQVHVSILRERSERCSLKLSAQRQVLTALDDAIAVVAFLDADSVPSANWLRAMVAPFADPRVGAATGIRWSAPVDAGLGTLVRHVFNALSFPQRYLYRIPWGGSLAVRRSALHETGLLDYWSRCFCEDTSAYGPLRAAGLRLAFVPAATQINTEPTDIAGAHYFMLRQLVCLRLHHVYWTLILCVNAATALSFLICCLAAFLGIAGAALALVGIAAPFWKLSAFAIIPALYVAGLIAALAVGDHLVRRTVSALPRRVGLPKLSSAIFIALAHATYAVFKAPFLRSIAWRGITYDIEGRDRIRMRAYRPYCAADDGPAAARSIL
jgi:cellulose synthase/poly-beta-1,6-N-acetylglucosamine synthase-like glycosyltransferase